MTKDQVRSTEEALDLALDALTYIHAETSTEEDELIDRAITAIKQARSAPVQEPVAWRWTNGKGWLTYGEIPHDRFESTPLYTTPPAAQQPFVGLTDEDIEQEFGFIDELLRDCVHRTEAKLRSKNNG